MVARGGAQRLGHLVAIGGAHGDARHLAAMARARRAFDPDERLNPGKILPGEGEHDPGPAQLGGMRVRPDVEGAWI
jgi:hypothetical protein